MYSVSAISITRPPTSRLLAAITSETREIGMSNSRRRTGSTVTEYWRTKPPTLATSATPGAVVSW